MVCHLSMWLTIANIDSRDPTLCVHDSGHYCWVGTTKNSSIVSRPFSCERAECGHKTAIRFLSILVMFISSIHVVLLPFNFPPLVHHYYIPSDLPAASWCSWDCPGSSQAGPTLPHSHLASCRADPVGVASWQQRWNISHRRIVNWSLWNDVMRGIWDEKWCMRLTWPVCGHQSI